LPNISETLKQATEVLQAGEIAEPRREAVSLLAAALQKDKTFLIAHADYELSAEEEKCFHNFTARRSRREPFQYIVGKQEFYGLDFAVSPVVLIPRPETEMIVEAAIEILQEKRDSRFCEVGIGSGCIAVSILYHAKMANAIGLDVSAEALKVAKKNAEVHRVSERLELKLSNVFANLQVENFDLIVSNPPYIPSEEIRTLQAEVREFEPIAALTDGGDGLSIIETIIRDAPQFLKEEGCLLLEIGFNQSKQVEKMFDRKLWRDIKVSTDLQNIPRMVKAVKSKK
jgi:release factor glutamine methyltransferase